MLFCGFFFVKHKTAYEMRISDWSSDVCASDLSRPCRRRGSCRRVPGRGPRQGRGRARGRPARRSAAGVCSCAEHSQDRLDLRWPGCSRSEEHTSELQSLMRISYAVFCLKKKKQHNPHSMLSTNNDNFIRKTTIQ